MKATEIYKKTIALMGESAQRNMAIEECAELIFALEKENRGQVTPNDVITEIADVMIMTEQLAMIYGRGRVEAEKQYKQRRLLSRITGIDNSETKIEQDI